jgi:hypothetical protein
LKKYGSLFISENAAEVYADKIAGPNRLCEADRMPEAAVKTIADIQVGYQAI